MMDPISVAGIVQSSLSLALQLGTIAKNLSDVAGKYKNATLTVKSLAQNLEILQLTWSQIGQWFDAFVKEGELCDNDLVERVKGFLETGILVMEAFEKDLVPYEAESLSFTRRSKFIWNEGSLQGHQLRVRDQTLSMSLFLQAIKLPTPKARANLLRDSEDQFRKSDESAYSIDSVIPSQLSLSSSKRHSLASSAHASIEYQPFSFDKKLFLSRVYTRNAKNIMIKKIFKSRIQAGGKTKETLMPNWEAIRSDLEADSLLPSSHEASSADNESLRPSSYHENIEHRFQNKDPRSMTIHGDSAVFLRACEQGDSVQVKRLLVGGFNVHLRFTGAMYFGYTAIHVAALHGYVNVVEILLDHSADVNDEDARRKRRPLHFAAGGRKLPMVRFLIRRGARVDAEAHDAIQPIHEASWSGSVDIIDALIEGGAPVNCTDRFGYQPLHWAVFTPSQPNVIRYLSQMNADIDVEISSGLRAVHLACKTDPKNLSTLLALGAKTDFDDGTEPALIAAVEAQRKEAVEILLKHGVDPNQEATDGSTALHKLATLHSRNLGESSNDRETRRLLLDKGANLYVKDSSGNQVIHYLASQNLTSTESFVAAKELAELLLERGADGDATDRHGYGALYLAIICGNSLLSTLLFTRGARILKRTGLLRMEVGVDTTINSQVPKHVVYSWQYNLDHSGWMKRATDLDFVVSKSDAGYIIASQMKQKLVNLEHYLESTFE